MALVPSKIVKSNDIIDVDDDTGVVYGWAIVCKFRKSYDDEFEDYYDLNIDTQGVYKGQRVPECFVEGAMYGAAIDIAKSGMQMVGNDMHEGPDIGRYYFVFPLTEKMAKGLEIQSKRTGLIVGYHPGDEAILKKFKDGTYTGFSVEGARVEYEEVEV